MDKTLHIKVSEELYFRLVELKGKMKAKDWTDLLDKICCDKMMV
jgi:hypothetical protein